MIYLLAGFIGFLLGIYFPIDKVNQFIHQLTCPHTEYSSREIGFQTFYNCKCCGKVWE